MTTRHRAWAYALAAAATLATGLAQAAAASKRPDTVYLHGKVVTLDAASDVEQAFAVKGDRFVAVGPDAKVRALAGKATRIVDLHGATVVPGFSDSHDHMWNAARYLVRGVDLVGVASGDEVRSRLRAAVGKARPGEVVFTTMGWSVQPALTRRDLDQISTTTPIALIGNRRGMAILNRAALARLGVSKANPLFEGAKVPVDADGEPTGVPPRYPASVLMLEALLPPLTTAQQDAMIRSETAERNALGITSIRELAVWPPAVAGLQRMRREGKLNLRVALGVEFPDQANTLRHLAALGPPKRDDPWLILDSVSEEPWTPVTMPAAEFTAFAREVNRLGWRAAPHVNSEIGRTESADDAVDFTLNAYEAASADSSLVGKRWYVEHAPLSTPEQIARIARLGVIASTQDLGYRPAAVPPPVSAERLTHFNPTRGFLDHGVTVIGGSDYNGPGPVDREPNNPMIQFYFYTTRKTAAGDVRTGPEKVGREAALRAITINEAYATFQETMRGPIAPGLLADFVVLNQDLMTVPDDKILATRPLATFVGGRKVYAAKGGGF